MQIVWHGFSCFKITETRHGGEVALVTDPFSPEDGKKLPRSLSADVVTVSHAHPRHDAIDAVSAPGGEAGKTFVIEGPGEYEVKDVFITGIPTFHDMVEGKEKGTNTMYYVTVGDLHLVHLGDLKHPLEEKHMEEFHNIDVLFVPVGGGDVLTAKQAADVVGQLEPRIIVPMHYKTNGYGAKFDGIEPFLKAMGMGKPEILPKLKLAAKDLPQEETKIILLEPQ
jgi:L-ascorbate metabolism protein UlaG (beta-lactamase superfamily)